MKSRSFLFVAVALVLIAGFSYAGWSFVRGRENQVCSACLRPVHANSRTIANINGKPMPYCCPACALSEHKQTGARVEVTSLTDYDTGSQLDPGSAYLVRGSDVNVCSHHPAAVGIDKQPIESHFDRCSPSMVAFANRSEAERFVQQHGGNVLRFEDVATLFR